MKNYYLSIGLITILGILVISGCASQLTPPKVTTPNTFTNTFKVNYYSTYTSSGGDIILDIVYTVNNGEITSCDGTYTTNMRDGKNTYDCDVEKLKKVGEYNVPLKLITEFPENQEMTGEVKDGPSYYKWEIILE